MIPEAVDDILIERQPVSVPELLLSGDGVFHTIQGEGPAAGQPATFVRLAACNLMCGINDGWKCDSAYTWDWAGRLGTAYIPAKEAIRTPTSDVLRLVREPNPRLVVITGGEPLLQDAQLEALLGPLHAEGRTIHMETNGTRAPAICGPLVDLFVVSPKLASSGNGDLARQLHPLWLLYPRVAFKFVITAEHRAQDVQEVLRIVGSGISNHTLWTRNVWLMPEGIDAQAMLDGARELVPVCQTYGFNLSLRQHILLFGDERAT